jgi:hypothetical protein
MTVKARKPKPKRKEAVKPKGESPAGTRGDELSIDDLSKVAGGVKSGRRTRVMPIRK